jgi:cytochrome c-type biogenesis protein CcmH/NrfG
LRNGKPGREIAVTELSDLRMKTHATFSIAALLVSAALQGCAYVKHVPPGQSLSMATARKPEVVAMPTPTPAPLTAQQGVEPPLPADTEKVADAFTLGNLCMQQGRYPDAVTAYQAALKADPTFADAWSNLAIAYQNLGQNDKAMEAFKKYKMVAVH